MANPRSVFIGLAFTLLAAVPGAAQPAFQVEDILTGPPLSPITQFHDHFAEVNGIVFFSVNDGIHG